ncbi:MAG: carboxypeptidase regulatory-like domain-containing protein [Paraprevotella sp.]|nr:carboxypeptidase regulatory-like domain-containing protein [Paraprevotella sp.]
MKTFRYIFFGLILLSIYACSSDDEAFIVTGTGRIFGNIIDAQTHEPVQGASVTIYPGGSTIISGKDGLYEFNNLPDGGYILQLSKPQYLSNTSSVTLTNSQTTEMDLSIRQGTPCLDVLMGELNFGNISSSKVFVVSNISNEKIHWELYTDYTTMFSFDQTEGILNPGENAAVNVSLIRGSFNADNTTFPIYVRANNDEMGVIASLNRTSPSLNNSLLLGEWTMVVWTVWSPVDNEFLINSFSKGQDVTRFNSDFTADIYTHQISPTPDNRYEWLNYAHMKASYSYDPANNVLGMADEYGESIFHINQLTENRLVLELVNINQSEEEEIREYVRR